MIGGFRSFAKRTADRLGGPEMDPLHDTDDADLIRLVRAGDKDAWLVLTRRYTGRLWSVARAMRLNDADAADAVQTTWLRLVENLDHLREPEHVGGWLCTTIRRECLKTLNRRGRVVVTDDWDDVPDRGEPLDRHLLRDERDATLWRGLQSLEPRCQSLIRVLIADPPPAYTEVAAALGMRIGSIGPTRKRCLAKLRAILRAAAYPFETPASETA
jgi:RNA polymerase sigma factor (sigma-70 family)